MDVIQWTRIQELFLSAVELPPIEQKHFLLSACQGDIALQDDVLRLLEADARADGFLDSGLSQAARQVFEQPVRASVASSDDFTPYRLVRVLGEGGMGIVFLAERDDLKQQVAIKVLRDAHLSPARLQRFATEQRILAQLNHPSIGRLYDASHLPDGTPYFVMEYVEGVPLTEYCGLRNSSIRERVELFRTVCEAAQYAHAHALIHRDLKPSNILVKEDESIRLLDFGIAKQLDDFGDHTATGLGMATPAYAAPEQMRGGQTGIRTDVYSLGVILYQLIAGKLPFDLSSRTPGEAELIILNEEPLKPSIAKGGDVKILPSRSEKTDWEDLDVLCLVAMHKEPDRRYQTVEALIRDLDHYLKREPLEARPDSFAYRAGKFVRRNRRQVIAALAMLLLVVGLVTFFVVRLTRAKNEAVAQAARSGRIKDFMLHLFDRYDQTGPSVELRATDVLDLGVKDAQRLGQEPAVQRELFKTLGDMYLKLGKYDRANSLFRAALALPEPASGSGSISRAEALVSLGAVLRYQEKMSEGLQFIHDGLAIATKLLPANDTRLASMEVELGRVLVSMRNYKEAIKVLSGAAEKLSRPGAPPQSDLYFAFDALGTAYSDQGQFALAEPIYRRAIVEGGRLFGHSNPLMGEELTNLGSIEFYKGRFAEAEKLYRSGLETTRAWYGPNHADVATQSLLLGQTLLKLGQSEEGTALLRQALKVHESVYGKEHPIIANDLNALAVAAMSTGHLAEAEVLLNRALLIQAHLGGGRSAAAATAMSNLADLKREQRQYRSSEDMNRRALVIIGESLPSDHIYAGFIQLGLGRALLAQKRFHEAEPYLLNSYEIFHKQGNPSMRPLKTVRQALVEDYAALRRPEESRRFRSELAASVATK